MTIIEYWREEYKTGDKEETREREEEILNLLDTNIEAFLDWCVENDVEYDEKDMRMWRVSFDADKYML